MDHAPAATKKDLSIAEAATLALPYSDRARVRQLAQRIPADLQGLFRLQFAERADGTLSLQALQMQPNPALRAMEALQTAGGLRPNFFSHTSDSLVGRMRFPVEAIDRMLERRSSSAPPPYYSDDAARSLPSRGGLDYAGSFALGTALRHPSLAAAERIFLERVSQAIPTDLRGSFFCDLKRSDGALSLARLSVQPIWTLQELEEAVLNPGANAAHYRHPQVGMSIDRNHLQLALSAMPPQGRALG